MSLVYLRRAGLEVRRSGRARLLAGLAILGCLLFAKVWESTVANALSMERDRLRREVRSLENRIRLSSEISDQAGLLQGIDPGSLRDQGFIAPDPSRIIDIDLDQAVPRAVPRGMVALFASWLRRVVPAGPADAREPRVLTAGVGGAP